MISSTNERDPFLRFAALGGFGFLIAVVTENVLRAPPPMANAAFDEVVRYYVERHDAVIVSQAFYALAIPCLLMFVVGTVQRIIAANPIATPWACVGGLALAMIATFGAVMALDVVLVTVIPKVGESLGLTLWACKNALFFVNGVPLMVGLTALGVASGIAGVGPRWLSGIAVAGGIVSLIATAPLAANVAGAPTGLLGFVGFLVWLVFLVTMSISHLRAGRPTRR